MSTQRADTPSTSAPSVDTFGFTVPRSTDTSPTSLHPSSSDSNRWSELIPPKTALTFAVLWDPKDDFVAFSGAQLLDATVIDDDERVSPSEAFDDNAYSQILTIEPSTPFVESESNTAMLAFYRDNHALFSSSQVSTPRNVYRTQTSSTLDGLDVYLRGSLMGRAHNHRHYSCMEDLSDDFQFDPQTSFARLWTEAGPQADVECDSDEGFFETWMLQNSSSLRGTEGHEEQCSSNNDSQFVTMPDLSDDDGASSEWSTIEVPDSPPLRGLLYGDQERPRTPRRLKKRRPNDVPTPPLVVLRRQHYGHDIPPPPVPPTSSRTTRKTTNKAISVTSLPCMMIPKIVARLRRHRRTPDSWVFLEITQAITQREI